MSHIETDAGLLAALGFREREAGDLLGRTRQAINAGAAGRTDYFKIHDIVMLLLEARILGKVIEDEAIRTYLLRTRGADGLKRVDALFGPIGGQRLTATSWTEVWVMLPDYRHLRRDAGSGAASPYATVVTLPDQLPQTLIRYICASPVELAFLQKDLEDRESYPAPHVLLRDAVPAAAQMTMIIADPNGRPVVFVPSLDGFVEVAYFDGQHLVDQLRLLFPADLLEAKGKAKGKSDSKAA
jgi:hypothetical protein